MDKKKPNEFDLDIIGKIEKYMREDNNALEVKEEIKNVREALHPEPELE